MRLIEKEEKDILIDLCCDVSNKGIKLFSTEGVQSFTYDLNGLANKLREVIKLIEWIENNQPENTSTG